MKSLFTFYSPLTQWLLKSTLQKLITLFLLMMIITLYPSWRIYQQYQAIATGKMQLMQLKQQLKTQLKHYQQVKLKSQSIENQSRQIPEINQKLQLAISNFPALHILSSKWEFDNGAQLSLKLKGSFQILHQFYQHLSQQFPKLIPLSVVITQFSEQQLTTQNKVEQENSEFLYSHLLMIYDSESNHSTP